MLLRQLPRQAVRKLYRCCVVEITIFLHFDGYILLSLVKSTKCDTIRIEDSRDTGGSGMDTDNLTVFVDESGSIKKGPLVREDYFVIALIFTDNERFLNKVFKKKRFQILNQEEREILSKTKEVKGSDISDNRKKDIYSALVEKCGENLEVGIIVLDLKRADDRLKQVSSRAFNFLIARYLAKSYKPHSKFNTAHAISFFVDERNVATGAKFTLEEYLNTEYNIEDPICEGDISVHYLDSKNRYLIQLADFIANTFYRAYKKNDPDAKGNVEVLKNVLCNGKVFYFPMPYTKETTGHIM